MLSQQLINELQAIIKSEYGQDLDTAIVADLGNKLVSYCDLLDTISRRESQGNIWYNNNNGKH